MADLLSTEAIQSHLKELTGWRLEGAEIVREFSFPAYLDGIQFTNRVARAAEELGHHPDIHIGWRKVTMRLSTHSKGGLTELDFALAKSIDRCAG